MTTPDDAPQPRTIDLEIEVAGTPEQVWAAIATGPGISAWLHHTEIEEREGGRYAFDMGLGGGLNDSGVVAGWEPPRRFATGKVRWEPAQDGPPAELATEWTVQARSGDTCVVRMVMSGFGTGDAWDNELDGMAAGMRAALESLRSHLARGAVTDPARPALPRQVMAAVAVADVEAALPWYQRFLGRAADDRPMDGLAEWHVTPTASIQLVADAERAGSALLTLAVDDLEQHVAVLAAAGVPAGTLDDTSSAKVLFATVEDPEGNRITLVQARGPGG